MRRCSHCSRTYRAEAAARYCPFCAQPIGATAARSQVVAADALDAPAPYRALSREGWPEEAAWCHGVAEPSRSGVSAAGDSEPRPADSRDSRVPILRTSNWAEAGYFEDLLLSAGFDAQLQEREQFDAAADAWRSDLLVLVPRRQSADAIALVERELSASDMPAGALAADDAGVPEQPPGLWKPLVFAVVAGGLAYVALQGLSAPRAPAPRAGSEHELFEFLRGAGGAWHWQGEHVERRMHVDRAEGRVFVEEDLDGDGRTDRTLEFGAAPFEAN